MNQSILLYLATFLTAALGLVIGLVAYSYRQLIKKYYSLKDQEEKRQKDAQAEADKIIADAKLKAESIISQADSFMAQAQKDLADELTKLKDAQTDNYRNLLSSVEQESVKMIKSISSDVNSQITAEVSKFMTTVQQEISKSQEAVLLSMREDTKRVQKELDEYKTEMMVKIDNSIYEILANVSIKVIGKTLSVREHEELVLEALNAAKRQQII